VYDTTANVGWVSVGVDHDTAEFAVETLRRWWTATPARRVLTQQAVAAKANEIGAMPELLSLLEWKGAVVTIDAMGCQKAMARQSVEAGGD
jgi:hypothetical protein